MENRNNLYQTIRCFEKQSGRQADTQMMNDLTAVRQIVGVHGWVGTSTSELQSLQISLPFSRLQHTSKKRINQLQLSQSAVSLYSLSYSSTPPQPPSINQFNQLLKHTLNNKMDSPIASAASSLNQTQMSAFTLPESLTIKHRRAPADRLASDLASLQLSRSRPGMSDLVDQEVILRLSQKFQARLKVSENTTLTVDKSIKERRRRKIKAQVQDKAAPQPGAQQSSTELFVEKLRRKERDEIQKVLQKQALASRERQTQRRQLIETLMPVQKRQKMLELEQQVRQKQQQARMAAQQQREYDERVAREAEQARLREQQRLREEQERREKALAAERERQRREQERLQKERQEREKAAQAAAAQAELEKKQKAEAEAKAKAEAEAKAQAESEARQKAQQEESKSEAVSQPQEVVEEQKGEPSSADVPDISSSLLPPEALRSRNKSYLQPSAELGAQMAKNVAAWKAYEAEMDKYKVSDLVLDKPFFHVYPNGEREQVKKVGEAITRVSNTINRPQENLTPDQIDAQFQHYADLLIQRVMALNEEFKHNPEVIKFAIYKLLTGFASNRFVSFAKSKDLKARQSGLGGFMVNIFDRLHFQLPQLHLKEMVLGFFASRNMLFYPKNAQLSDCNDREAILIEQRGFRLAGGKREGISATITRLSIHASIFFSVQLSDAYIGRLFITLSTLLCLRHTQNQAQVILHLLEVGADRLLQVYGRAHADQLRVLKNDFCPSFRAHIQSPEGLRKEPQNKVCYLPECEAGEEPDTGSKETGLEHDKLCRLVDQLLLNASQAGF